MDVIINRGCYSSRARVSKAPVRIVRYKMAERTGDDIIFALVTTLATHSERGAPRAIHLPLSILFATSPPVTGMEPFTTSFHCIAR